MQLMTKEMEARFMKLGPQDTPDAIVVAKYFTPDANWTWWATSYDPETKILFGLVQGLETELGYFSLEELESVKGPLGLGVERDLWFKECSLAEVKAQAGA